MPTKTTFLVALSIVLTSTACAERSQNFKREALFVEHAVMKKETLLVQYSTEFSSPTQGPVGLFVLSNQTKLKPIGKRNTKVIRSALADLGYFTSFDPAARRRIEDAQVMKSNFGMTLSGIWIHPACGRAIVDTPRFGRQYLVSRREIPAIADPDEEYDYYAIVNAAIYDTAFIAVFWPEVVLTVTILNREGEVVYSSVTSEEGKASYVLPTRDVDELSGLVARAIAKIEALPAEPIDVRPKPLERNTRRGLR